MRPKSWTYTPSDDNLTGFASNVTGASWTLTATTVGDSLAHKVTIRNDSATDHSGKTAALVGTDADGKAQTETMALPGVSATTTSTKYFKTLTSITPSVTIGADTMDIGWNDVAVGPTFPLDYKANAFSVSLALTLTGTISLTVQHTFDDIFDTSVTPVWFPHASLVTKVANSDGNYAFPVRATRLLVNSLTTGATVTFSVIQSSDGGC